ncbi:MAG: hypothetical protein LC623_08840 [Halobacteriales archaeon]|nr:hypothetical protein [Halobacteriales archaeon]
MEQAKASHHDVEATACTMKLAVQVMPKAVLQATKVILSITGLAASSELAFDAKSGPPIGICSLHILPHSSTTAK